MTSTILLEDFRASPEALNRWMYNHWQEHNTVVQRANLQSAANAAVVASNAALPSTSPQVALPYPMAPTSALNLQRFKLFPYRQATYLQWLTDHQQAHNDFNSAFNLQGADMQDIDFKDDEAYLRFIRANWQEHIAINRVLGI